MFRYLIYIFAPIGIILTIFFVYLLISYFKKKEEEWCVVIWFKSGNEFIERYSCYQDALNSFNKIEEGIQNKCSFARLSGNDLKSEEIFIYSEITHLRIFNSN